ncbi:MAG: hypothetical protein QOE77_2355 [Blastocatellia bacterium]|jgi:hypothetical protein|nr:hypothetical protein [Blastocatellia bacterium]
MIRISVSRRIVFSLALLTVFAVSSLRPQTVPAPTPTPQPPTAEEIEKAEQIIKQAIAALGGDAYLNVRNTIGRGFFSPYKDGKSEPPLRFVDYIVYPDRERTEFRGGGGRLIQTHLSDKGWQYDGAAKTLKDLQAAQVEDFKISMRTSVENLLRGWWRKEGGTITFAGRREAGLARRNLTVRLTYPDGFWVEHEFGAKDGLPAKTLYQRKYKRPDIEELEMVAEEDRYYTPRAFDGVTALFIIDHFRAGTQTGRINYESIEFNQAIPDSLFTKPATIKEIK